MDSALLSCLTSQQARECESNCLHTLADLMGPIRRCPHCGEDLHQPESPPQTPPRSAKKAGEHTEGIVINIVGKELQSSDTKVHEYGLNTSCILVEYGLNTS